MKTPNLSEFSVQIFEQHMIRKTKKQKQAFRDVLVPELERLGWPVSVHSTKHPLRSHNVMAGNVDTAEYIFTAHYDTPAVLPFPNFVAPLNLFVSLLYQLLIAAAFLLILGAVFLISVTALENGIIALLIVYVVLFGLMYLMLAGPANRNNANDNTSGVLTLLEIARNMTPEQRAKTALVFFDNEEKGLVGSYCFAKAYPAANHKPLINFDCVGDGDTLLIVLSGKPRKNILLQEKLTAAFAESGQLTYKMSTSPFVMYPSDQAMFKQGIGVVTLCKAPIVGLYLSRLHTRRDVICKAENIEHLCHGAVRLVQG